MGISSVKAFTSASERPLMREMAEVPVHLMEDFTRHLFRLGPKSRVFQSQMEVTIHEINTGKADFIGWLMEKHPEDIPECDQALGDFLQRASQDAAERIRETLENARAGAQPSEAEIPKELFEDYVREIHGLEPGATIEESAMEDVISGIAEGRHDFPRWAFKRGYRLF